MKLYYSLLLFLLFFGAKLMAQTQVNGFIQERVTKKPINNVNVYNLSNKESALTNAKGVFKINAEINDVLVFAIAGFKPDTLLLINLQPLRRNLEMETNMLSMVTITDKRSVRDQNTQIFNKANAVLLAPGRGLLFYPSAYFSKEGKQARKLKRALKLNVDENIISKLYNLKSITAILPLQQPELDAFFIKYKPSLKFVKRADADDFKFYLYDAYNKFKLLPAAQRVLPSLKVNEGISSSRY